MSVTTIPTLLYEITQRIRARAPHKPALIGVAGAQGSGKTTQCRAFAAEHAGVAHFSLDDVYFTKAEREALARAAANPIFATRGPPGTHDLGLASGLIARLRTDATTALPRFDKVRDDRAPEESWPTFHGPATAIIIDGWCLGALPPPKGPPINTLEHEDIDETWRGMTWKRWQASVRTHLEIGYARFFAAFDALIYLQAPNWEIVRRWRAEQEEENLGRALRREDETRLDRFLMHYERLTRSMLAGHHSARWIVHLDERRNVVRVEERC